MTHDLHESDAAQVEEPIENAEDLPTPDVEDGDEADDSEDFEEGESLDD